MKTNKNHTQKTEPSAEDKALTELIRKKVLDFIRDMNKLCKDNSLSFDISGWVENPVDRGDVPEKTLTFKCGNGKLRAMFVHKIADISVMLQDCVKKFKYDEVTRLVTMVENLIGCACNKVMTNLNKNKSQTKEN